MHDIFKKSAVASDTETRSGQYLFPEILKQAPPPPETVVETLDHSFQRIFIDAAPETKTFTGGLGKGLGLQTTPERQNTLEDYQKLLDEMAQTSQQKEADAFQRGVQEGKESGYVTGQKDGYAAGHTDGYAKGQDDGYAKGYETGTVEGRKNIEPTLHMLQTAMDTLRDIQKKIELKAEKEIVLLAIAIARKVILQEPSVDHDMIVRVAKNAMAAVTVHAPLSIRIHPSDAAYIAEHRAQLPVDGDVMFVSDAAITPGGCAIEGASGNIDARIETQLQIIEDAFAPRLEKLGMELAEPV